MPRQSLQPGLRIKVEKLITGKALTMQELMKACNCGEVRIRNALAVLPVQRITFAKGNGKRHGVRFIMKSKEW